MMPVSHCKYLGCLLLCGLLPVVNAQAENTRSADEPSMDFLEYLGGVENEIDGELSSPVELDLEPAVVASSPGSDNNINKGAGNEEKVDE
jgi:hypothetical protein